MTSPKISQLQLLQQNIQTLQGQKQQMQEQLVELHSAITELKTTDKAYHIIGKIMLAASKEKLLADLEEKKEIYTLRVKNFTEQEEKIKKSIEKTQKEVMEDLHQGKTN